MRELDKAPRVIYNENAFPSEEQVLNNKQSLVFRVHAIQRMFERAITKENVRQALATGKTIEAYPEDQPYPSRLVLGWAGTRPIHVVVADNQA